MVEIFLQSLPYRYRRTSNFTPTSVLDIGCGDGLITNFYAFIYPQAEVIALDLCGLCLISTRTIAARLGLKNLQIVQGDASNLRSLFPGRTFDLVLARAFSPFMNRCGCDRSLGDPIDAVPTSEKVPRIVQAIRHILNPINGRFISTENWTGTAALWCWASTLASRRPPYRLDDEPRHSDRATQMVHAGLPGEPYCNQSLARPMSLPSWSVRRRRTPDVVHR